MRQTFFTPLDRDKIQKLTTAARGMLELPEEIVRCLSLLDARATTGEA